MVTGGAGFIGSHLTERILNDGNSVTVLDDLSTGRYSNLRSFADNCSLRIVVGSVLEAPLVEQLIRDVDGVFHLASAVGVRLIMEKPIETIETIFSGTDVILRLACRYRRKVFLASTSEVYGKSETVPFREDGDRLEGPTSLHRWAYACAKALDEFLVLAYHRMTSLPVVVARLFNTVGPRQSAQYGMVIPRFVKAALRDDPLYVYGDGQQSRCFCHVLDSVDAIVGLMNSSRADGQVINVGSNEEVSIRELAERIVSATKSRSEIRLLPYDQAFPGGGFEDMRRRIPCLDRIGSLIGWVPRRSLDEIIEDVIREESGSLQ